MPLHKPERPRAPKKRREEGWVAEWRPSKSGGFGVICGAGSRFFFHRRNLLEPAAVPKVGHQVRFTPLPPAKPGTLRRATEIEILPSTRRT